MRTTLRVLAVLMAIAALAALAAQSPREAIGLTDRNSRAAPTMEPTPTPLRVLVIGGTRGIGLEAAKRALQRGHTVTVFARRPSEQLPRSERLTVRLGDIRDRTAVQDALRGQQVVISAISAPMTFRDIRVFSEGMRHVLTALEIQPETRLLAVTGIGAGDSAGHGGVFYDRVLRPSLLRTTYADKDREEALVRASPARWTLIRPGFLTNGPQTADYRSVSVLDRVRSGSISRADVAHFLVATAESGSHAHEVLLLTH